LAENLAGIANNHLDGVIQERPGFRIGSKNRYFTRGDYVDPALPQIVPHSKKVPYIVNMLFALVSFHFVVNTAELIGACRSR
jgi:hypothetical protein